MKILVACEYSGRVRDAFIAKGHHAVSCDMLPTESFGPHYQGDVTKILGWGWDMMIAFPPCTHLSKAGAAHWKKPHKQKAQTEALDFVRMLLDAPINFICIENPVGKISTAIMPPTQKIQPYEFGHPWLKETCLWLKNLPPLMPTQVVEPKGNWVKPGNNRPHRRFNDVPEGGRNNWKDRSLTFEGIANAMADQWSEPSTFKMPEYVKQTELF